MKLVRSVLDPDLPAVAVTGSIAETIGSGRTAEGVDLRRFSPWTIEEDQGQAADRAICRLWSEFEVRSRVRKAGEQPRVDNIAPPMRASTCPRIWPKSVGSSRGSRPRSFSSSRSAATSPRFRNSAKSMSTSASIASRPELVRDAGQALARGLLRPVRHGRVPARLGEATELRSRALHRVGGAYDPEALVGSLALGNPGFLRDRHVRNRGRGDLCPRCAPLSRARARPAVPFRGATRSGGQHRQPRDPRARPEEKPSSCCSPATTSGCSCPRSTAARSSCRPRCRERSSAGATCLLQEVCNALVDALVHILPLGNTLDRVDPTPSGLVAPLPREKAARRAFEALVERESALTRIWGRQALRARAEQRGRANEAGEVEESDMDSEDRGDRDEVADRSGEAGVGSGPPAQDCDRRLPCPRSDRGENLEGGVRVDSVGPLGYGTGGFVSATSGSCSGLPPQAVTRRGVRSVQSLFSSRRSASAFQSPTRARSRVRAREKRKSPLVFDCRPEYLPRPRPRS